MPLIPLSGPISMSMLNTAVNRSATTSNSLLASASVPGDPGLFYLGYQINNDLNQIAPHAISEWYGFDSTTTTSTTTTTTTGLYYNILTCCATLETGYLDRNISGADVALPINTRITVDSETCPIWIVIGFSDNITGYTYVFGTIQNDVFGCEDTTTTTTTTTSTTTTTTAAPTTTTTSTTTTTTTAAPTTTTTTTSTTTTTTTQCPCVESLVLNVTDAGTFEYTNCCGDLVTDNVNVNSSLTITDSESKGIDINTISGTALFTITSYGPCRTPICPTTTTTTSTTTTTTTVLNFQYTMTRCDIGGSYTWILANSLNDELAVYTDMDPSGAGAGSRACYTVVSNDGTTSSAVNKTAYLVSGGCSDSVCIL